MLPSLLRAVATAGGRSSVAPLGTLLCTERLISEAEAAAEALAGRCPEDVKAAWAKAPARAERRWARAMSRAAARRAGR